MRAIQTTNLLNPTIILLSLALGACSTTSQQKNEKTGKFPTSTMNKAERDLFADYFIKRTLAAGIPIAGREVARLIEEAAPVLMTSRNISREAAVSLLLRDASRELRGASQKEFTSLEELSQETFEEAQFKNYKEVMAQKYPSVYAFKVSSEEASQIQRTQRAAEESRGGTKNLNEAEIARQAQTANIPEAEMTIQKYYSYDPKGAKALLKVLFRTEMSLIEQGTCDTASKLSNSALKNLSTIHVKQGEVADRLPESLRGEKAQQCFASLSAQEFVRQVAMAPLNIPQGSVASTVEGLRDSCKIMVNPLVAEKSISLARQYDEVGPKALEEARTPTECTL